MCVFPPPDHFYIKIFKILSEERVSIIVTIFTWIFHFFYYKNSVEIKRQLLLLPTLKHWLHLLVQIINIKSAIAMSAMTLIRTLSYTNLERTGLGWTCGNGNVKMHCQLLEKFAWINICKCLRKGWLTLFYSIEKSEQWFCILPSNLVAKMNGFGVDHRVLS